MLRFLQKSIRPLFSTSQMYNPYTSELVSKKQYIKQDELYTKISMAAVSQRKWKQTPLQQRIDKVTRFVKSVIADKQTLKPQIAASIGKSYQDIDEEFKRLSQITPGLISAGNSSLRKQYHKEGDQIKITDYQPLGLALIFPYFSQPIFDSLIHLIPCLIAGNGALLKTSDYNHFLGSYLSSKAKSVFGRSSLVTDMFIQPQLLPALSQFRSVKKIIYAGSHQSAKHIFQTMIKHRFIDCNVFFGGKDAAYVDQSADLALAAREIIKSAFYNNGQSYVCIKRVYVDAKVQEQLVELMRKEIESITLGDPTKGQTRLGPLCNAQNAQEAQKYVSQAASEGVRCVTGGLTTTDGESGAVFFEPTLLQGCTNDTTIIQMQVSAPVLGVVTKEQQLSISQIINENQYGTGVHIFTQRVDSYQSIVRELELGRICFNSGSMLAAGLPVEGWKKSGKGKILSELAYEEYSLPKSYYIRPI